MKRTLALFYGVMVYVFFLGTFLYTIAFVGNFGVRNGIDSGRISSVPAAIAINLALLAAFAVQHSVMARKGFKKWWTRFVPKPVERTTFVLSATIALAELLWQWRAIPSVIWDVRDSHAATLALTGLFGLGWAVLLVSTFLLNHFELFGLEQVWNYFLGREARPASFKTPGLYRVVRHPIYLGFVIGFWATPLMTTGHLLLAIGCTAYILVGIAFEERDLIAAYGQKYLEYRRRVPMLMPSFNASKKAPEGLVAGLPHSYQELTFEEIIQRMDVW